MIAAVFVLAICVGGLWLSVTEWRTGKSVDPGGGWDPIPVLLGHAATLPMRAANPAMSLTLGALGIFVINAEASSGQG